MAVGRKTGGRQPGSLNVATREIKALAQQFGPTVIGKLAQMSGLVEGHPAADSETARIAAMKELLDRGYGKPAQTIGGDRDNPLFPKITVLFGDQDDTENAG